MPFLCAFREIMTYSDLHIPNRTQTLQAGRDRKEMEKGWSDDGEMSNGGWVNGQIEPCASMWAEQTDP